MVALCNSLNLIRETYLYRKRFQRGQASKRNNNGLYTISCKNYAQKDINKTRLFENETGSDLATLEVKIYSSSFTK